MTVPLWISGYEKFVNKDARAAGPIEIMKKLDLFVVCFQW